MAPRAATVTQSDIARALRAAQAAGLTVSEFVTTKDGVRVITTDGAGRAAGRAVNSWDPELEDGAAQ